MNQYKEASKLLGPLLKKNGPGLKSLAFGGKKKAPSKAVYATVCHTLRSKQVLDGVLGIVDKARKDFEGLRDKELMYVLLYELLLGPYKGIRGGGGVKRVIMKHEKALQAALVQLATEGDAATKNVISSGGGLTSGEGSSLPTVKPSHWPKYIRVNTLKATLSEAVSSAKEKFGEANVAVHQVVDNVLVLPSTVNDLYEWDMIVRGEVIIQDLSSCLTAVALGGGNGTRWWDVGPAKKKGKKGKDKNGVVMLDACAAPGNKTTHLAAIVNDGCEVQNQVIALDRASERIKILEKRVKLLGGDSGVVEPRHQDFLKVDSGDAGLKNLRAILLDPSCSGSGIVNSPDRVENSDSSERLRSLASFQLLALVHSMSFPQVNYIAYSTCSVNVEEDEAVVAKALKEGNAKLEGGERWQLVAPVSLKGWKRRGLEVEGLTKEQAACLCRSDPFDGDVTNGFFVSYFERVKVAGEGKREGTIGGGGVGENADNYELPEGGAVKVFKEGMFKVEEGGEGGKKQKKKKGAGVKGVEVKGAGSKGEGEKKRKAPSQHSMVPADISDIPKKKLKKMLYKQRQREQKLERMKKKKAEGGKRV